MSDLVVDLVLRSIRVEPKHNGTHWLDAVGEPIEVGCKVKLIKVSSWMYSVYRSSELALGAVYDVGKVEHTHYIGKGIVQSVGKPYWFHPSDFLVV